MHVFNMENVNWIFNQMSWEFVNIHNLSIKILKNEIDYITKPYGTFKKNYPQNTCQDY
jgi:hypothetical protein